jgi:hypothetical protein
MIGDAIEQLPAANIRNGFNFQELRNLALCGNPSMLNRIFGDHSSVAS